MSSAFQGFVMSLSPNDKVPGAYIQTIFGVNNASLSNTVQYLLLVGQVGTGSTIALDTEVLQCFSDSEADAIAGPGSELARMARAALRIPGIRLKLAAPTISGGTKAAATLTIDGTWSTAGTWILRVGGVYLSQAIKSTDGPQQVAQAIAAYINARTYLPVTAAAAVGSATEWVVTLTAVSSGLRGNDLILWQDSSFLPNGLTSVIAGGASVGNGGKRFASGAGVEDVTTLLTTLYTLRYWRIAAATRDATNLGRWVTQLDNKADPLVGKTEHAIFACSGTLGASTSLAQTSLDNARAQLLWMKDAETPPPEIAAVFAAIRYRAESLNPSTSYDDEVLPGVQGQTDLATVPNRATLVAALDVGLTPVNSIGNNSLIVRSITTRTLTATGAQDDGTIDTSDSAVPDAVRDEIVYLWVFSFVKANKRLRNNPTADEPDPPAGVAYPKLWAAAVKALLQRLEALAWIVEVAKNPPVATMHPQASRIVFYAPVVPAPANHQVEGTVAQLKFQSEAA
jgi:phage tail sheath gpL-like